MQRMEQEATSSATPQSVFLSYLEGISGFKYHPDNNNCLTLANDLKSKFELSGMKPALISLMASGARYIISTPSIIDSSYTGGVVRHNKTILGDFRAFESHHALILNGTIYDPTSGYVGPKNLWCATLSDADIDPPEDSTLDLEDQFPIYGIAGDLNLPEAYAYVAENKSGEKITVLTDIETIKGKILTIKSDTAIEDIP